MVVTFFIACNLVHHESTGEKFTKSASDQLNPPKKVAMFPAVDGSSIEVHIVTIVLVLTINVTMCTLSI